MSDKTETFVIVGQNRWGAGPTVEAAKARFRQEGGKLTQGYGLLVFDADTTFHGIDNYARYEYTGNPPTVTTVKAR